MSAGIRDALSKLEIKRGDVLLVSDQWVFERLTHMKPPEELNFYIPVIYTPDGTIQKASRKELETALINMPDEEGSEAQKTDTITSTIPKPQEKLGEKSSHAAASVPNLQQKVLRKSSRQIQKRKD